MSLVASPSARRWPWLDVLRGLAILMVLVYHALATLLPSQVQAMPVVFQQLHAWSGFLHLGVNLFFVLSGFLITGILLDHRGQPGFLARFYADRAARILPAYGALLAILWCGGFISTRFLLVSVLFLNDMPGLLGAGNEYGPLWSLSVEEQFYLVWPALIWMLPRRCLPVVCAAVVLGMPAWRWVLLHAPAPFNDVLTKPWAVADHFAAGGLLAWGCRRGWPMGRLGLGCVLVGVAAGAWMLTRMQWEWGARWSQAFYNVPALMLFSGGVALAVARPGAVRGLAWRLARPVAWLGHISYGLYLVHQLVLDLVRDALPPAEWTHTLPGVLAQMVLACALAMTVAAVSRATLEAWFLSRRWRARGGGAASHA